MDELHDGRRLPTDELPKCPRCDGEGWIEIFHDYWTGEEFREAKCPDCNGTGYQQPEETELGG